MKACILISLFLLGTILSSHAQKVVVSTTVEDFVVTQLMLGCPSYGGDAAIVVDYEKLKGSDKDFERLEELITRFETENGAEIKSQTNVRNFVITKDEIKSTTKGPLSGAGKQLCDQLKAMMP